MRRVYIDEWQPRKGIAELRYGEVGPRPYTSNNPYFHFRGKYTPTDPLTGISVVSLSDCEFLVGTPHTAQQNALYQRVVERARGGDTSQLMTAVAEWNSSLGMVAKRAIQLRSAYRALRKGDLVSTAKWLSLPETDKSTSKRAGRYLKAQCPTQAWLEYWMGWAPMYGDIYNAIDVLQRPVPDQKLTVGVSRTYRQVTTTGEPGKPGFRRAKQSTSLTMAAYAKVKITNHNLLLANQLGLVNPAQTAWEVVPFSFAVDWVTNVGQVLGSLTDFLGLGLYDTGLARMAMNNTSVSRTYNVFDPTIGYVNKTFNGEAVGFIKSRSPGQIPTPSLTLRLPHVSLSRAATSISLLTEIFLIKDRKR